MGSGFPVSSPTCTLSIDLERLTPDLDAAFIELSGAADHLDALAEDESEWRQIQRSFM